MTSIGNRDTASAAIDMRCAEPVGRINWCINSGQAGWFAQHGTQPSGEQTQKRMELRVNNDPITQIAERFNKYCAVRSWFLRRQTITR